MRPVIPYRFSGFGIELTALRYEDLPILCKYRNSPEVLPFMEDGRKVNIQILAFWLKRVMTSGTTFPFIAHYAGRLPILK